MTWDEADKISDNLALGYRSLEDEMNSSLSSSQLRFMGIQAKNSE
jgi:hypothetical protein